MKIGLVKGHGLNYFSVGWQILRQSEKSTTKSETRARNARILSQQIQKLEPQKPFNIVTNRYRI